VNQADQFGQTLMQYAVTSFSFEITKYLVKQCQANVKQKLKYRKTRVTAYIKMHTNTNITKQVVASQMRLKTQCEMRLKTNPNPNPDQ